MNDDQRLQVLTGVFEIAQEGALVIDPAGRIVDVNPAFGAITGYHRLDVIGAEAATFLTGPDAALVTARICDALHAGGRWDGEVIARRKNGTPFAAWCRLSRAAGAVVAVFADISHVQQQADERRRREQFDELTGLANRALLVDRIRSEIERAERSGRFLAVAYLDIDNFRDVNARFGRAAGDGLLVELAGRVRGTVRGGEIAARLGGDEFVLVIPDLADPAAAVSEVERLMAALTEPLAVPGLSEEILVSASIGVCLYPGDVGEADTLIRHAGQAMESAKQRGRKRYVFYDVDRHRARDERRERLDRLRAALNDGEFVMHYQPKVNMRTGDVLGVEALIRWQHPERGLLSPAEFLPDILNSDLDVALGEWVIATALAQIDAWQHDGFRIAVSVNVSAKHILSGDFEPSLRRLLAVTPDVSPELLQIEVLETSALGDVSAGAEIVDACRSLGVTFALDDFGTGYSSLTLLRRLAAETLKIDQSFVSNMHNAAEDLAIVNGVIALAAAFKRTALAEGVETLNQGLVLLLLGCESAQGYFISRPMSAQDLPRWVARWRPPAAWSEAPAATLPEDELTALVAAYRNEDWVRGFADGD